MDLEKKNLISEIFQVIDDSYIRKEDLDGLIKEIADYDGFIKLNKLFLGILSLERYDDVEELEKIRTQPITPNHRINNIRDDIGNINKYQQDVKSGLRKSYLLSYFEKYLNIVNIKDKSLKIYQSEDIVINDGKSSLFYKNANVNKPLNNTNTVKTLSEVREILGISKGKADSLRKNGIIKEYQTKIQIEINNIQYKYKGNFFKFYDLEDIKKELRAIRKTQN